MDTNIQLQNQVEKKEVTILQNCVPAENRKTGKPFEVSDILGDDGKWQRKIFFMTLLCGIIIPFNDFGISFLAYPVEYWCERPHNTNISLNEWKNLFLANISHGQEIQYSQCEMPVYLVSQDGEINFLNETVTCKSWEYSDEYYSIVEEWNLVCDKSWMPSLSQSLYMIGFLGAVFVTGQISDLIGRRWTINVSVLILLISSIVTAFSTSFEMFVILRCFVAMGQSGMDLATYVLVTEVFGSSCRATYILLKNFSLCLGHMLLPLIAWLLSDWFYLQLVFALTSVCYIHFFWYLPESPRWLLSRGHVEKAISAVKLAAKENGIVNPNIEEDIKMIYSNQKKSKDVEKATTIIDLFKTPNLRKKTLCLFFIWISLAFTYYGLSFYSTELNGNKFFNFFLSAVVEVPSTIYCLVTANRYGRKKTLFFSLAIGGLSCLVFIFIPNGYEGVKNAFAIFGKMFVSAGFIIIFLFSAEIFPTVARNVGMGVCSMVARIGTALSPFMRDLGQATNSSVPLIMFGSLCVVSAFFTLKLPETNSKPIPETLNEAETDVQETRRDKGVINNALEYDK